MTHLEMVNRILRRLRESQVQTISQSQFSRLIGDIVADSVEEVQKEFRWSDLRSFLDVDTVSGQRRYNLGEGGDVANGTPARKNSKIERDRSGPLVFVADKAKPSLHWRLQFVTRGDDIRRFMADTSHESRWPTHVWVGQDRDAPDELVMNVWPTPNASTNHRIRLHLWTEHEKLDSTGNTDATEIKLPTQPVMHLALLYALTERGDDLGENARLAQERYLNSLAAAKEQDIQPEKDAGQFDWFLD